MVTYDTSTGSFIDKNPDYVYSHMSPSQGCTATLLEQKLLLKTLEGNKKRLAPEYRPRLLQYEDDFEISFLLPIGPLSYHDVGKLNLNTGCAVCGRDIVSRCSQCQSISYCGTGASFSILIINIISFQLCYRLPESRLAKPQSYLSFSQRRRVEDNAFFNPYAWYTRNDWHAHQPSR